ncbi:phage tail protein [Acinetobacter haemolyticus]|uniref:TipJ family phage tail tip protein n=1 Tax=Acinetobacter haemolyticus TaxID=29430 RepID=UPI0013729F2C|nr:phage tail protein [Acinetobacter haemolyticus]NAR50093.1 phage tail protein [Acinetobacter haemolyticus]NAR54367.1 phage tail protein [Acinetobacter haemolyticus]
MTDLVKGGKKGNKQPRQPVIAPDSAQSKTYIKILYGLSEGEVEGLADGNKSIKLENTPLIDANNGGKNFQDVKVDFRNGTNDQDYIEGFPSVDNETAVDVELTSATPWVKAFTNLDLDAIRVRLRFGPLRNQNMKNGDVTGYTIEYAFDLQTDGGPWTEVLKTKISDKTSANYERAHRIDLPSADTGWQIRVRRITPNRYAEDISDTMYVAAITEVIDVKLRYPNTALLGLQYDAETFNNVAKVAVDLKGLKVKVPSNYNPVTRSYMGIWDGTFVRAYSNNPAWIYYDICTADRYGLGDRLTPLMIDKWSLYRLAQYCDQLVPDGLGGQEPRFTCNVYLQNAEDAFSVLTKLAGVFRAISFWDGNSIICDADIPQDTYFAYSRANVIDGLFEYSGTRARDRHNVIKVAWDNPANGYKTEYEFVRDEQAIGQSGQIRILDLDAWGCTSRGQAQRVGHWALKSEQLETRTVTFKVGLDGYIPLPGRVIEISDELFAGRANGGRVSAVSTDKKTVTLDRDVTVKVGDKLVVNGENGIAQTRIVQSVVDRKVTVTIAFDEIAAQNVWVLNSQDLATMKFRVISITQDEKHQFKITALQYNSVKFDAIDNGAYIDDAPISIINPTVQEPVSNVVLRGESLVDQGINITSLVITWQQAKGAVKYLVEWRKDDGSWIKLQTTGNNSVEVQGVYAGNYQARVTAISAFEISSLPVYSLITELSGKQGLPPQLAFIRATGVLFGIQLDWGFPAVGALDTAYTEIEVSPDGLSNIAQLGLFSYPTTTHTIQGLQGNLTQKFRGRLIDKIGNVGAWSDWAEGTTSADPEQILEILEGHIGDVIFDQDTKDKLAQIEANAEAITKEVQDRINAVTAEETARAEALTAEANARALAITKEANDRANAIALEATNRSNAIATAIIKEVNDRNTAISVETTNRINAINKEVTDRNAAINAKATEINGTISSLNNALNQEVSDRQAAVQAETNARVTAVSQLQDGLTTETNQRKSEDASLLSNIETYKTSTNNTLASVQQSITTNATNISSQAAQINALDSRLTTTDNKTNQALTNAATAQTTANTAVTAAQAASSQVTNLRSEISTGKGTNLLKAEYSDPVVLGVGEKVNATIQLIGSPFRAGKAYNITNNTASISNRVDLGHLTNVAQTAMNAMAGRKYLLSCMMVGSATGLGIRFVLRLIRTGGATPQTVILKNLVTGSTNFVAPTAAQKVTFYTDTAITGDVVAATLQIYVGGYTGTVNPAGSVFVLDSLMVEEYFGDAREGSPYVPGPFNNNAINDSMNAVANAMSALDSKVTTIDGKVTTNANAITSLNNELNTVKSNVATKADSSALNALQSTVTQQGNTIASHGNSITTLQNNVSTINGELETKANATAVTALDNKVTSIDGRVTTNSNAVTSLNGRVTTVENGLTQKADASALNNYYTKTEADNATAGSIQQYNASLVIGGDNLVANANNLPIASNNQGVYPISTRIEEGIYGFRSNAPSNVLSTYSTRFIAVEIGKTYTVSYKVRNLSNAPYTIRIYLLGTTSEIVENPNVVIPANGEWVVVHAVIKSLVASIRLPAFYSNTPAPEWIEYKECMFQEGTKYTGFTKSPLELEQSINANATAIQNTQSQVTSIDGRVTSNSNSITTLQNRVTNTENGLSTKADSSAVQALDSKVTTIEGTVSSQGSSITSLQNSISNLKVAGGNLAIKSNVPASRPVGGYAFNVLPLVEALTPTKTYTVIYLASMQRAEGDTASYIRPYIDGTQALSAGDIKADGENQLKSFTFVKGSAGLGPGTHLRFYCFPAVANNEAGRHSQMTVHWAAIYEGNGLVPQVWTPSYKDNDAAINANSSAVQTLDSKVTQQGNTIASQSGAITQLQNDLTLTNNEVSTKASAGALNALDTRVTNAEGVISSNSTQLTSLESRLTANVNFIRNTATGNFENEWLASGSGAGELSLVDEVGSSTGKVLQVGDNSGNDTRWLQTAAMLPFDAAKTYKLTARYRRCVNAGGIYIGVYAKNFDKSLYVSKANALGSTLSNSHYAVSNTTPAVDVWQTGEWYYRGRSTGAGTGTGTKENPFTLAANTAFIGAMVLANYSGVAGINQFDFLAIEECDDALASQANSTAINNLDTRTTQTENAITTQSSQITNLNSSLTTTNNNVTAAQNAAQDAANLAGSKGKVIVQNAAPSVADRLPQNLWIDTTGSANTPKRWNGSAWVAVTDKVATDAAAAAQNALTQITTKADASALQSLTSRVTTAEDTIQSQGSALTTINNNLTITTGVANAALPKISANGAYKLFRDVLRKEFAASGTNDCIVITTPITFSAKMFKLRISGYIYRSGKNDIALTAAGYAYTGTQLVNSSCTNSGNAQLRVRFGIQNSKVVLILNCLDGSFSYPKITVDAEIGHTIAPDAWGTGWDASLIAEADLATNNITNIITPSITDFGASITANSSALQSLTSTVTQQGNTITSQGTQLTQLQNSINQVNNTVSTKADASALTTVDNKVTSLEGQVTSQSSQVTQLQNGLNTTNNNLELTDALTRYQGQGKLLFPDTTFKDGLNSIGVYGTNPPYTRTRRAKSADNPSSSTHEISYLFTGDMNSGNFGFVPVTLTAAPNKVFLHKYVIKMPVGVFIQRASNGMGTGSTDRIIGSVQGTGKFETYWRITTCGSEGTFSTTGHIAFKRTSAIYPAPTPENPTDIVISQVGVWDVTDAPDSVPQSLYDSVAANASALSSLDSKVTQQGNTIQSISNQQTTLTNKMTVVEGQIATKAEANALNLLDSKVTTIDGKVATNTNNISSLTGRMTTVENGLSTKVEASTLNNYYTKTQTDSAIAGGITTYNASLKIGTANHAKNSKNGEIFTGFSGAVVTRTTGLSRDLLQGAVNHPFRLKFTGGSQTTKTTPAISVGKLAECVLSFKIKNEGPEPITFNWNGFNHPVTGVGQAPIYLKGKASVAVGEELEVAVHGCMRPDYEWLQFQIRVANLSYTEANVIITDIMLAEGNAQAAWTEPYQNVSDSISANATAIQNTETRVTNVEGAVTSQGSSITSINSSLDTVIDRISIKDTRDDNQPPNWYWTNHPRRVVTEFKTQAALGLSGMGTYVSLETTVPFSNATGGPIKQVAQSGDFQNYQYRYSTGSGVNAVWTEWKQYIKDIVNEMGTKASASALSALDTKVTQIDGKVDSNSSSITSLNSSLSTTNNNVTAAQNAANAANELAGGKGKVLFQSATPAVADRLPQNLWIDTTNNANTPKRWNGSAWAVVSDKAATDAATAAANALAQLQTKADASAVSALESRTAAAEGNISSLSSQTTILNNKVATAENNITANTNSISTLNNKVTVAENQIATQSSAITKLTSEIGASTTSIKNTATASFASDWLISSGAGELSLVDEANSYTGRVLQIGNNNGNDTSWLRTNALLPFDETKLYRLRYRYRRVVGTGSVYIGLAALTFNRSTYVSKGNAETTTLSGSHYAVTAKTSTLGSWVTGEAYYKGRATNGGTGSGTKENPYTLANKTAFIGGMLLANYNGVAGSQQFDYLIIEEVDALALGEANASALQSLDTQVSVIDGKVSTQASNITSLQTSVNGHTTSINNNTASIDGVKAVKTLTVDQDGVISGYGLVSEIINGQVTSTFGINATNFYIGAPSGGKKLLIVTTVPQTINGTQYPAGTWIDTANIASATIKNAHIQDAAITTAKIENAAITNAKIGNLSVSTLKIQDEAVTVPVGMVGTDIECGSAAFTPSNGDFDNQISEWENYLGTLITMNVNRSGGKAMLNAALTFVDSGGMIAIRGNYNALGGTERFNMRMVLSIYANGNLIGRANVSPVHTMGDTGVVFAGGLSIVSAIDLSNSIGNVTYTLKFGFGYVGTQSGKIILNGGAPRTIFKLTDIRMTLIEMKK